jgi:hypothetical protein
MNKLTNDLAQILYALRDIQKKMADTRDGALKRLGVEGVITVEGQVAKAKLAIMEAMEAAGPTAAELMAGGYM